MPIAESIVLDKEVVMLNDLCVIDAVPVDDNLCVLPVSVYVVDVVDNLLLVPEDDGLTIAIKGIINNIIMIRYTSSDCHAMLMNNVMVVKKGINDFINDLIHNELCLPMQEGIILLLH